MTTSDSSPSLPLPVRLFRDAMQRQFPLDAFASTLEVTGDELRALLTGRIDQLAPETIDRIAAAYGRDTHQARAELTPVAAAESFSVWFGRHMEGITQTSLRQRTQIAAPLLRAFVSGKALPDSDQAERLARALYVDRGEMARVIVADMTKRGEHIRNEPARRSRAKGALTGVGERSSTALRDDAHEASAPGRARQRRQRTSEAADTSSAIPATPASGVAPAPTPPMPRVSDETTPGDPGVDAPTASHRRRRAKSTPAASSTVAATPVPETVTAGGAHAVADEVATAAAPTTPGDATDTMPSAPRRGRRQAPTAEGSPVAQPVEEGAPERRPAAGAASPALARTTRRRAVAPDPPMTAPGTASPAISGDTQEGLKHKASGRAGDEAKERTGEGISVDAPASEAAQRTVASLPLGPAPSVAAVVSTEPTLHLTPDEARLIRLWRQLHPQGRRATLHYIGLLLVEE